MTDTEFRVILNSHPAYVLKKEIAKHNIKGYSKMSKAEIVSLMMANKERFMHLKYYVSTRRKTQRAKTKKAKTKKAKTKKAKTKKTSTLKQYNIKRVPEPEVLFPIKRVPAPEVLFPMRETTTQTPAKKRVYKPHPPKTPHPITGKSYTKTGKLRKKAGRKKMAPAGTLGLANFGLGLSGGMMSRAQINKRLGQALKNAYKRSH